MNELFQPIDRLSGVAEKRAAKYRKMGIETPYDLLYHFPRTYIDFTNPARIADAVDGEKYAFRVMVAQKMAPSMPRAGMRIFRVLVTDGETELILVFFNSPYTYEAMNRGDVYFVYGKVTGGMIHREMASPQVQRAENAMPLLPVYPQSAGLTSAMMRTNVAEALRLLDAEPMETLPPALRARYRVCGLTEALHAVHRPVSAELLQAARDRLAFEELLQFQLGTLMLRDRAKQLTAAQMQQKSFAPFLEHLPFQLTSAQSRAIETIAQNLCEPCPMNRLLQGDVGSGKTAVAAAAAYFAAQNGFQTALMAPTEILAQQHLETMKQFLEPAGVSVALLTASFRAKEKREIKARIASGEVQVVVGTHAVIQKDVEFASLGLVITDEQHRFGVAQRAALAEKGGVPHKLVMSATPIPRTLALIMYGDLDITILDEMPAGRIPIKTVAVTGGMRERAYGFIRQRLDAGEQAYLVCAMIEESDALENVQAAESYAQEMRRGPFAAYRVGLLHGRMKPQEKEAAMAAMKAHETDLLVCTTVVEVGVDVPNATVILIENADRFGLAQLHQLRGRVGRGKAQSWCVLVTDSRKEEAKERLKIMSRTTNGSEIAEADLLMRGPGDFFGHAQHGMPPMMQTALVGNMPLVTRTQEAAREILADDPMLQAPELQPLRTAVLQLFAKNGENGLN